MSACNYRLSAALLITALAAGCALPDRGRLANHAAGYSCDRLETTPGGLISAQARLDLAGVADAVARMRQLGEQTVSEVGDYQNRCRALPDDELEEVLTRTRQADQP